MPHWKGIAQTYWGEQCGGGRCSRGGTKTVADSLATLGAHYLPTHWAGSSRIHSHCSLWDCADVQLLRLQPGCISLQHQQSWQDHYLCNKLLIKAPTCCAGICSGQRNGPVELVIVNEIMLS